jgi:hypothetical protein
MTTKGYLIVVATLALARSARTPLDRCFRLRETVEGMAIQMKSRIGWGVSTA